MATRNSYVPAVVGVVVAMLYVAILALVGMPAALPPADGAWQFGVALMINAVLIAAPFLFIVGRPFDNAGGAVDIASLVGQVAPAVLSVLLTLGLYLGLGFKAFAVVHLFMAAVLLVAWLGLRGMRDLAGGLGARQALVQNRRESLVASLTEIEAAVAGMPAQDTAEARRVLSDFREEARLITPTQADRNPNLMTRLAAVIEDLRGAVNGAPGAKSFADAVGAMKATVETLKRAGL